jgi:predicted nucleic acid-binding protein
VDTTAWLALANKSDALHREAANLHQDLLASGTQYITTDYVLTEVANGLARPPYRHGVIRFLDAIFSSKRVTIVYVDRDRFKRGWQLYTKRPDKDWGLTDCISFTLMDDERIREAFTVDHHFQQAGYRRLLKPRTS